MAVRIQDVAQRAGVSSATVSRVLANKPHVREALKKRVQDAVKALDYQPNRVARSLRVQRSSVIGLIISDIQNSFFNTVVRAIEDAAYERGYAVFLCNSDEDPVKEKLYLELFQAERVAGIILTPTRETSASLTSLIASDIPVVSVDRRVPGAAIDTVLTNNAEASCTLVTHLIEQGHKRIGAVLSDLAITTGRERFAGYKQALRAAKIALSEDLVRVGRSVEADGYALAKALLSSPKPPTALFVGTKLMSLGALRAIYEQGLIIPDNIALAVFDKLDWMPFTPPTSYAQQPAYELGERAAQLLLERMTQPELSARQLVLPSSIYLSAKETAMPVFAQSP